MALWVPYALILLGVVAILVETIVPAFGLIGILGGGGSILAAIALTFVHRGPLDGTLVLFSAMIIVPIAVAAGFRLFPRTPIGRRLILSTGQSTEGGYTSYTEQEYEGLAGAEGVALTTLRPSGVARFNGKKYSVVSAGEYIEADAAVRVIRVEGSRVVVRRVVEAPPQSEDQRG